MLGGAPSQFWDFSGVDAGGQRLRNVPQWGPVVGADQENSHRFPWCLLSWEWAAEQRAAPRPPGRCPATGRGRQRAVTQPSRTPWTGGKFQLVRMEGRPREDLKGAWVVKFTRFLSAGVGEK